MGCKLHGRVILMSEGLLRCAIEVPAVMCLILFSFHIFRQNRHCFNIIISNFKNEDGDQGSHPQAKVRALNFVRSGVMVDCDDSLLPRDLRKYITQTRPCNIQQYFTAVKMLIFR